MSSEVKGVFASMMAIYEANPTQETAKMLSEKVMGPEAPSVKMARIRGYAAKVPAKIRAEAKKKYLDEQQPVPAGVPTSGMLMVGLGVVSKEEKDALMDAQAAARLLNDTIYPRRDSSVYLSEKNYLNEDGSFRNAFLDKPFATKIQRLEDMVHAIVDVSFVEARAYIKELNGLFENSSYAERFVDARPVACWALADNTFVQGAGAEALSTLNSSAKKIQEKNPQVAARISSLAETLAPNVSLNGLTARDYQDISVKMSHSPAGALISHRSQQILNVDALQRQKNTDKSR
jgi:hypothetical protein